MRFVSFDIESCDGRIYNGSLCSLGYCIADEDYNIIKQEDILVNPRPKRFQLGGYNEESAVKLAYSEEEFRASPRFNEVYDRIKKIFVGDDVIVLGFSIGNDLRYLDNAIKIYRLPPINFKFLDIQLVYSLYKENRNQLGLATAATEFGLEYEEHRSDEDARATLLVLKAIQDSLGLSFEELIQHYVITLGTKEGEKYTPCFSEARNGAVDPNTNSKESKRRLRNMFIQRVRPMDKNNIDTTNYLYKKSICFNEKFELEDMKRTRELIQAIYNQGGRYSTSPSSCDIFVKSNENEKGSRYNYAIENQGSKRRPISIITIDEFLTYINSTPELEFDDVELLKRYNKKSYSNNTKNTKNKQKAKKRNRSRHYNKNVTSNNYPNKKTDK